MSSDTIPIQQTAVYTALKETAAFRSILTTLAVLVSVVWIGWSLAHKFLGWAEVPVGVGRLQIFLAVLWFGHAALMVLINHAITTFFRVGVETVALTAAGMADGMMKAQAEAEARAQAGLVSPAPSTVTYLHEALMRRAEDAAKPKDQ